MEVEQSVDLSPDKEIKISITLLKPILQMFINQGCCAKQSHVSKPHCAINLFLDIDEEVF